MKIENIVLKMLNDDESVYCYVDINPDLYTDEVREYFKNRKFYIDDRCFNKFQTSPLIKGYVCKKDIDEFEKMNCIEYITKVRNLQSAGNWMLPPDVYL